MSSSIIYHDADGDPHLIRADKLLAVTCNLGGEDGMGQLQFHFGEGHVFGLPSSDPARDILAIHDELALVEGPAIQITRDEE